MLYVSLIMMLLVLVQPRKTHPDMTEKLGHKESKQTNIDPLRYFDDIWMGSRCKNDCSSLLPVCVTSLE